MLRGMNDLKDWLFENVYYQYPAVYPDIDKAKALVQELFQTLTNAYRADGQPAAIQRAVDFVSGMTDRYAMDTFAKLRFPAEFRAEGS